MKTYKIIHNGTCISVFLHTVLYCFHWEHRQVERVRSDGGSLRYEELPNSKLICYSERGEPKLSFVGHTWKLLKLYPTAYIGFSTHCIALSLRTRASWRSAKLHGGSLRYNSKLICYSERGEPKLSFEYKFVGHTWKLIKLYPTVHAYICFSTHCIALFPLRTRASWRSAKCTRRLFKVWRNLPKSKLICYSERGEPKLSFEYKFVGHTWKLLKLYPTVHAYLFFYTLYCIVSTENTGKLNECEVHT